MKKNDQKLRTKLQEKLGEQSFPFKEEAWAGMEQMLDQTSIPAPKSAWTSIKIMSLLCSLILLTALSIYVFNESDDSPNQQSVTLADNTALKVAEKVASLQVEKTLAAAENTQIEVKQTAKRITASPVKEEFDLKELKTLTTPVVFVESPMIPKEEIYKEYQAVEEVAIVKEERAQEIEVIEKEVLALSPLDQKDVVQDEVFFEHLDKKVKDVFTHYAPEKVYLHFDRKKFALGEAIWFSAYVRSALDFLPSKQSDLLYVDFYNPDQERLKHLTIIGKEGLFEGDIQLDTDLPTGHYTIKAYTAWQMNLGQYFEREIELVAALEQGFIAGENQEEQASKERLQDAAVDIQFFPEGGTLLEGVPTTIAFKGLNTDAAAIDLKGTIFDRDGVEKGSFQSYHGGMGAFELEAAESGMYAMVAVGSGQAEKIMLPEMGKAQHALSVEKLEGGAIEVKAFSLEASKLNIVLQSRNKLYQRKTLFVNKAGTSLRFSTAELPIGIASITAFDEWDLPVAERLIFVNKDKKLNFDFEENKEKYKTGEEILMKMKVTDESGKGVEGRFSVGIAEDFKNQQGHLLSSFLLESELKGKLDAPNFYFDENESELDQDLALDYLMMTQGYRTFGWKKWEGKSFAKLKFQGERAVIAGVVKDENGQAIANAKVKIPSLKVTVETDENGRYEFSKINLYDNTIKVDASKKGLGYGGVRVTRFGESHGIVLQQSFKLEGRVTDKEGNGLRRAKLHFKNGSNKYYYTDEEGNYSLNYSFDNAVLMVSHRNYVDYEQSLNPHMDFLDIELLSVKEAKAKEKRKARISAYLNKEKPSLAKAANKEEGIFDLASNTETSAEDRKNGLLSNRPRALKIRFEQEVNAYSKELLETLGRSQRGELSEAALKKELNKLSEQEGRIKQLESKLSSNGYLYALNFNEGYYRSREFYRPKLKGKTSDFISDLSPTLYWNAALKTNEKGEANIRFKASDKASQYKITVEGFNSTGGIGRGERSFNTQQVIKVKAIQPAIFTIGTIVEIPLSVENLSDERLKGKWMIDCPDWLKVIGKKKKTVELKPKGKITTILKFKVKDKKGEQLRIGFKSNNYKDIIEL